MENTTKHPLIEFIQALSSEQIILLETRTSQKMNKKDVETKNEKNPFDSITKLKTIRVKVNPQYEAEVNDQLEAEGKERTFEAKERTWGTNIGNGIVEHNSEFYVSYIPVETISTKYVNDATGEEIQYSEFSKFVPVVKKSTSQGTDDVVKYASVKLSNIVSFTLVPQ